jgi:DNA-directed RNA polymerase
MRRHPIRRLCVSVLGPALESRRTQAAAASAAAPASSSGIATGGFSDDLPPLAGVDDFDEFSPDMPAPSVTPVEEEDPDVGSAIDELLDDLMQVRTDVLRNFARTHGVKLTSKTSLIVALLDQAKKEGLQPPQLKMTKRVLGENAAAQLPTSSIRTGWNNSSLEATMLEHACARLVKGNTSTFNDAVRQYSKRSSWISQRLLRMYQEEYHGTANAAVGGIFRSYKHEADQIVATRKPSLIMSAFSSFLCTRVTMAETSNLVTATDMASKLIDQGIVSQGLEDEGLPLLERIVDMIDDVAAEVEARFQIYHNGPRMSWGKDKPETLRQWITLAKKRHAGWELENVPPWVTAFVGQFHKWEALVRNDVPELRLVPAGFFDALLVNLSAVRALKTLHGESVVVTQDIPSGYRTLVRNELMEHFGNDDTLVHDALLKLNLYCRTEKAEKAKVSAELFESILLQMQATLPDPSYRAPSQRTALALGEFATSASRCEHLCGLHKLLVNLTEDMQFHLRFAPVYDRMNSLERSRLRTGNVHMMSTLMFFEQQTHTPPPSVKCVAFFVSMLLYFCLRPAGAMPAVLTRLASCTGREDLSILTFTDRERDRMSELNVAFPPQLSHESWLQEDPSKNIYKVVPAHAVKSSTSSVMLLSRAPIIRALDAISRVPWRVNKYMLHVQEAMVQEGYGFGKIRPAFYPLNYCRLRDGKVGTFRGDDGEERDLHNDRDMQSYSATLDADWRDLQDTRSSRVHYLQALRQARALVNEPAVYFPNNMDFRGRMYPLPGRLNHTGSDPFRALLEHSEPMPLGHEGLYWLKVHVANKMGQSKLSFDDRVKYIDDHEADVHMSAESPLKGDRWWQDTDEPMQALMACKELSDALKNSQGAHKFQSRLPVAVDGSYNGLQHYSAIGRDEHGAHLVNLVPSGKPADAYTGILKEMMKSIVADAAADHEVAIRCLGTGRGLDKNHIKRKTIKRPIMTQVYGVTQYGMGKQVEEELTVQNKQHGLWLPAEIKEMAQYIRDKINLSLGVTFSQTQKCREWLDQVTRLVWSCQPRDLRGAFMWTTPLGLIVRQPYRAAGETHMFTPTGYTRISGAMLEPASVKQLSALAPNLIHSLDATHLAMTALEMQRRGHKMMAVHDSYWSHACNMPVMSQVLREQFVDLYTNYDPLTEVKEQWEEQFFLDLRRHGVRLPDPPERGKLDLQSVLKSDYFFS